MTPEREQPSAWGDPARASEGQSELPSHESSLEPHSSYESVSEPPLESFYEGRAQSLDGSVSPPESSGLIADEDAGLSGYQNPELSAVYENPGTSGGVPAHEAGGESTTTTYVPLSHNGSHAAGGQRFSQAWPLGYGHASVTKRREHRILRGVRSVVALAIIALALGVATAASLGVIVWLIATAIHHAASN